MTCSHCHRKVQARDLLYCACGAGLCRRCRVFWGIEMALGKCPVCSKSQHGAAKVLKTVTKRNRLRKEER
jgi:hypothetical protein